MDLNNVPFITALIVMVTAFIVEAAVEYFAGRPFDQIERLKPWKWTLIYIAAAAGLAGAILQRLDILAMIHQAAGEAYTPTLFGQVLTGLAIGRGSNFIHDLWKFILTATQLLFNRNAKT